MLRLGLKIPPLLVVLVLGGLIAVLARRWPAPAMVLDGLAYLLGLAGGIIAALGVWEFRVAGTTVDPRVPEQSTQLVVRGVYRYSRNPMYLGFLLVLCGWALYWGSGAGLVLVPVFVLYMNRFQIRPEEHAMREKFGAQYAVYCDAVRRWV